MFSFAHILYYCNPLVLSHSPRASGQHESPRRLKSDLCTQAACPSSKPTRRGRLAAQAQFREDATRGSGRWHESRDALPPAPRAFDSHRIHGVPDRSLLWFACWLDADHAQLVAVVRMARMRGWCRLVARSLHVLQVEQRLIECLGLDLGELVSERGTRSTVFRASLRICRSYGSFEFSVALRPRCRVCSMPAR